MLIQRPLYGYKCDCCGREGKFTDNADLSKNLMLCSGWHFVRIDELNNKCYCKECFNKQKGSSKIKRYYSICRPVSIGTYPREGVIRIENFDDKEYCIDIKRGAWGIIEYNRTLTEEELLMFELVPDPNNFI